MPLNVRVIEARYQPMVPHLRAATEALMLVSLLHCQLTFRRRPEEPGLTLDAGMSPEWAAAAMDRHFGPGREG